MNSPDNVKWKRLSTSTRETRIQHHGNFNTKEPDTYRRLLLNMWIHPDLFAQAVLRTAKEEVQWIDSGTTKGRIPIRAYTLEKDETNLLVADVGPNDFPKFLEKTKPGMDEAHPGGPV